MKKVWTLLLVLSLALCLCACQFGKGSQPEEPEVFTFPASTTVLGVDISAMTQEAAWSAVETAVSGYSLELTVDGAVITIPAQDMDLKCDQQAFADAATNLSNGFEGDFSNVISFNEGKLRAIMSQNFNKDVTEASIVYDETAGQYVLLPDANGQKSNPNELVAAAKEAICGLLPQYTLSGVSQVIEPVRSADDPAVQEALAEANKMIGVQLSYTFTRDGMTDTHDIPADVIRSFVSVGEDGLTPLINSEVVETYVTELSEKYSVAGKSGAFKTTGGSTVDITVSYNGNYVDNGDLTDDIINCLKEGTSGTRNAPYQASGIRDMPYGGTYVEVNLSAQKLWFYKNGKLIVSSSLVSGKVAENMCTPTGVYSLYNKKVDTYLVGEDYKTFVNYWMPFHGGYGLHDATWRSSFGGDIYLYNGSHGCVNLPLGTASKIYNNISVGTKVILYGGTRQVAPSPQKLTGTTSYDVANDIGTLKLNIKPKYKGGTMTYSSSNPDVATVDSNGVVTIKGIGTAKIKVSIEKFSYYTAAETTVTIKVHSACDEGRHTWGSPTTVKAPTCQPGTEKVTCSKCGQTTERELAPIQNHAYGDWSVTKAETCGADGKKEQTCGTCGHKNSEVIPATGKHTFGDWKVDVPATCVDAGTEKHTCTVCGKAETRATEPTGNHSFDTWVSEKDPTCTEAGVEIKICGVCGEDSGESRASAAKGHSDNWSTVKEATCTEPGEKVNTCKRCGTELGREAIAPKGHTDNWTTQKDATCTESGLKVNLCKRCGTKLDEAVIPPKDHSYEGGKCKRCGKDDPNAGGE